MHLPQAVRARGRLSPEAFDRLLALVLLALGELQAWLGNPAPHDAQVGLLATVPMYATVALRRRYPAAAGFAAQAMVAAGFAVWGGIEVIPYSIAWGCSLYGLTVWTPARVFAAAVVFAAVTNLAASAAAGVAGNGVLFTIVTVAAMLLVRRVIGDRERRAQLAERERDVAVREAMLDERARIAREMHDVIAHHVSVMVLQAGGERRALGEGGGATREVLETIEQTGRGALVEMRRLVGMLRDDAAGSLAPQPGLADVPTLVEQLREAGLRVELEIAGERRELPVGIELSAYRIVQEALTNVLKHAGAAQTTVHVRYGGDSLDLEIVDDGGRRRIERVRRRPRAGRDARAGDVCGGRFEAGSQPRRRIRRPRPAADEMTRVLIVDDQALVRTGFP